MKILHHLLSLLRTTQAPKSICYLLLLISIHGCAYQPISNAKELKDFGSETKIQASSAYRCRYIVAEKGSDSGRISEGILFITENSAYLREVGSDENQSQSIRKTFEIEKSKVHGVGINSGGIYPKQLQIDFGNEVYAFLITNDSGVGLLPEKLSEVYSLLRSRGYPEGTKTSHIHIQSTGTLIFIPANR